MTKKQYRDLEAKPGRIRVENRQIENITLRGNGHGGQGSIEVLVELVNTDDRHYHNEIIFPINRLSEFLSIFVHDDEPDFENGWKLSDYNGKYLRLCWYVTPEDEMHELADEEYLYAIKHITEDTDTWLFLTDYAKQDNR